MLEVLCFLKQKNMALCVRDLSYVTIFCSTFPRQRL